MTKRRIIALLMSCFMVLGIFPGTVFADECAHDWAEVRRVPANCTYSAYVYWECSLCGDEKNGEVGAPNGEHDYADGICSVCGAVEAVCEHENTKDDIIEASCSKEGSKKVICKDCGETVSVETLPVNDSHAFLKGTCVLCGAVEAPAECEHDYVVVDEEPATCVDPAYVWEKCSLCGDEKNGEVGEPTGEHDYVVVKEEPATCVDPAYAWAECSLCGAETNGEVGEPTGKHEYHTVKVQNPTCTQKGYEWQECVLCGYERNGEFGEPTGEHGETRQDIMESTCVKEGYSKTICKDCDEVLAEETLPLSNVHVYRDGVCLLCEAEEPVVCEHDYKAVREEPATCAAPAYVWKVCSLCGAEKNGEVGEVTDEHVNTRYDIIESTCVKAGIEKIICKDCGKTISEKKLPLSDVHVYKDGACLLCEAPEAECEHANTKIDILEANCSAEGYEKVICKDCGYIVSEEILPLNDVHFFYNGECKKCGAVEAPCAHENTKVDILEANCSAEGYVKVICKDCDAVVSEEILPLNDVHFFYNGECKKCGAVEAPCAHENTKVDILEANCSAEGYVKVICKDCDAVVSEEILPLNDVHFFYNGECKKCGAVEACAHDYIVVKELAATCVEAGYVWKECTLCGSEKNHEVGEANGLHDYVVVKELAATCVEAGYVWKECSLCGAEKNHEVGEATGEHDYTDGACTVCGAEAPAVDVPEIDNPVVDEPQVDKPVVDVPVVDVPTVDVPTVDVPEGKPAGILFTSLFNVTIKFDEGGKINTSKKFVIVGGASRVLKITPEEGFEIADVIVNGESIGAVDTYTIKASKNYTIEIIFAEIGEE